MKKLTAICFILLLVAASAFCLTACGDTVNYEVTVDAKAVSIDTSEVKICIYALDGTKVGEAELNDGKAKFALVSDSYVATLAGLDERVSFSSVLLTKGSTKATIVLAESESDEFDEGVYKFAFTVIMLNGERAIGELSALICDYFACRDVTFEKGNVVDVILSGGECSVEVFDADKVEIYNETFTLDLDARFHIITLQ